MTPEAQAWAREFRRRIPMTTDLQLARRLEPDSGRLAQQATPGGAASRDAATGPLPPLESSEDEAIGDENAFRESPKTRHP